MEFSPILLLLNKNAFLYLISLKLFNSLLIQKPESTYSVEFYRTSMMSVK